MRRKTAGKLSEKSLIEICETKVLVRGLIRAGENSSTGPPSFEIYLATRHGHWGYITVCYKCRCRGCADSPPILVVNASLTTLDQPRNGTERILDHLLHDYGPGVGEAWGINRQAVYLVNEALPSSQGNPPDIWWHKMLASASPFLQHLSMIEMGLHGVIARQSDNRRFDKCAHVVLLVRLGRFIEEQNREIERVLGFPMGI